MFSLVVAAAWWLLVWCDRLVSDRVVWLVGLVVTIDCVADYWLVGFATVACCLL